MLPTLGVGLGHRSTIHDQILAHKDEIDWLEVITDDFLGRPSGLADLHRLRQDFTLVPHGLEMSVGSDGPLDTEYLHEVAEIADAVDAPWVSDHLCFTRDGEVELASLTPVLRTREKARAVAAKAQQVQDHLGRPFLLENIAYYIEMPGDLTEAKLITEVLEHCECGLLLDLNNVAVNAVNHGFDPLEFLDELPLERVVQVHLAGNAPASVINGMRLDGHNAPVGEEVFGLLAYLVGRHRPNGILIERDELFPDDFEDLMVDLRRTREIS